MPTSRRGNDAANDLGASGRAGSDDLSELSTGPRTGSDDLSDLSTVPQALSDAVTEDASANEPALQLGPLTALSLRALNRLAQYKAPRDRWPQVRRAAVLVALFAGRHGDLCASRDGWRLRSARRCHTEVRSRGPARLNAQ